MSEGVTQIQDRLTAFLVRRLDLIAGYFGVAIFLICMVGWLRVYGVNFPYADDFSQLLAVPIELDAKQSAWERLQYLVSLSVEHRIGFLRFLAWLQAKHLGGIDFTVLMAIGWTLLAVAIASVATAMPKGTRGGVFLVGVLLAFSPANYEAQYWATGALQHFGVIAFSFLAIRLSSQSRLAFFASLVFATLASLTSANGILALVAMAIVCFLARLRGRSIVLCFCFVCVASAYWTESSPSSLHAPPAVWRLLSFYLLALGSAAVWRDAALLVGVLLSAAVVYISVTRLRYSLPAAVGWLAFLTLSVAAMAIGRHLAGDDAALISRYRIYSEMAMFVVIATGIARLPERRRVVVLPVCGLIAAVWFVGTTLIFLETIRNASHLQVARRQEARFAGLADFGAWPPIPHAQFLLEAARSRGYFEIDRPAPPSKLVFKLHYGAKQVAQTPPWRLDYIAQRGATISLFGTASSSTSSLVVWIENGDRLYYTTAERWLDPLAALTGRQTFGALVSLADVKPGRYRVGFSANDSNSVSWTQAIIQI